MRRFCLRSSPLTPHHISQNFHFAYLPLTLQGDTSNTFLRVIGRKKIVLISLAGQFKILSHKLKFSWERKANNIAESPYFLHLNRP